MSDISSEYREKTQTLVEEVRTGFLVLGDAGYQIAAEKLLVIADFRRQIVDHHAPMKKKAHEAHAAICAAERKLLEPVAEAERILKTRIGLWETSQRALEEERRRQADAEACRIAEEAREREIEQAEAEGADAEEVAAIIDAPLPMVMPRVEPVFQPAQGISTAKIWKAEVTSLVALIKAIAAGQASATYVQANEVALNQLARATRGTLQVPGVRFYEEPVVRAGRRF